MDEMKSVIELEEKLNALGVDPKKVLGYKMDDYFHECPYFIRPYESKWQVFHWERGQISDLKEFRTERAATKYIYLHILESVRNSKKTGWLKSYSLRQG